MFEKEAKERARKIEENQTLGVYDNDEDAEEEAVRNQRRWWQVARATCGARKIIMTDEEMAEEFASNGYALGCTKSSFEISKKSFLAGLKAGKDMAETNLATIAYMQGAERYKPKWHKVADGYLPKDARYVWTNVGPSHYDDADSCWRDEFGRTKGVIAWCEPKFEEN